MSFSDTQAMILTVILTTLASEGKLYLQNFLGLAVLSLQAPYGAAPKKVLGVGLPKNSTQCASTFQRAYENTYSMVREQASFFWRICKNNFPSVCQQPPMCLSFKKLIMSTPRLLQGLHMMSLVKVVPDGIKDKKCKRSTLQEIAPVPYVPEKDPIQEMVPALKSDQSLMTSIGGDAELHLPIWYCGTCKAFLVHVSTAVDAIKKRGPSKAHKEACEACVEQHNVVKQAKVVPAILNAAASKGKKTSKKSSEKASQKAKESMALADAPDPELHAEDQADYEKDKSAAEAAKSNHKAAATKMFQFYANLLSADAKYAWNKVVKEQTEADPFKDLQGVSSKSPKGLLNESFNDCVMFYLLTLFPNNVARKKSATFQTCSRSHRGLAYVSLYSA